MPDTESQKKKNILSWLWGGVSRRYQKAKFALPVLPDAIRVWISRKFLFTILPILLIIVIFEIKEGKLGEIGIAPELSFAAIVLFDSAVGKLMYLTSRRNAAPERWVEIARILQVFLVLATTLFVFASLKQRANGFELYESHLTAGQLCLLATACIASLMGEVLDRFIQAERDQLPEWLSRSRYYSHMFHSVESVRKNLRHLEYALEKRIAIPNSQATQYDEGISTSDAWREEKDIRLTQELQEVQGKVARILAALNAKD